MSGVSERSPAQPFAPATAQTPDLGAAAESEFQPAAMLWRATVWRCGQVSELLTLAGRVDLPLQRHTDRSLYRCRRGWGAADAWTGCSSVRRHVQPPLPPSHNCEVSSSAAAGMWYAVCNSHVHDCAANRGPSSAACSPLLLRLIWDSCLGTLGLCAACGARST